MFEIVSTQTVTTVQIDPAIVVVDKRVEMGSTEVRAQYSVTAAVVTVEKEHATEDYVDVVLKGYRLTKTGKPRTNARWEVIPPCYVATRYPDGNMTFDSSAYEAIKQDAILAASGVQPEG